MTTVVVKKPVQMGTMTETVTPTIALGSGFDYSAKRVNDSNVEKLPDSPSQDKRVTWSSSLEDAQRESLAKGVPYALYVCADSVVSVAGEGPAAWLEYKQAHSGASPQRTVVDDPELVAGLTQSGVAILTKVSKSQSKDAAIAENSLLIFAPNGDKLASAIGLDCNREKLAALIREFPEKWKQRKARDEALGDKK
jgi:hypothetical protein